MENFLKTLSVDEKIKLCAGKDYWHMHDLDGKLYLVRNADGPLGLRRDIVNEQGKWIGNRPAVAFPSAQVLAQTWNKSLAYKTGECLADECIEREVDVLLAPGVNVKRDPRCGRNFEYFSEDPYVAGVFGREYINGIQDNHVGTSLKHFCANNIEHGRYWNSSEVDERTLREIYMRAFEVACEANPLTVMSSYNRVNGCLMSENKKLYDILRSEFWREDGLIMSDWYAVRDHVTSVKAGCDLEMPFHEQHYKDLVAAYESGDITEEEIDRCALRVLKVIEQCRVNKAKQQIKTDLEQRMDASQSVATEGAVLLKNNGILPLKQDAKVHIVGMHAGDEYFSGGGSSRVANHQKPTSFDEALGAVMPNAEIGIGSLREGLKFNKAFEDAYGKEAVFYISGDSETEGVDRHDIRISAYDEMQICELASINPNLIVILRYGAAVDVSAWEDKVAAIIYAGYGGCHANEALADLVSGKVNFSGRLAETFAKSLADYPCTANELTHAINRYTDGLDVGYRYFDSHPEKVQYPFGFGLSYSTFEYSDLKVDVDKEKVNISFSIENTSDADGADVAQIYVHEVFPVVYRPYKELSAFEKVFLKAGEKKTVSVTLSHRDFAYYSIAYDKWTVNAGKFEIQVGKNAQDICLTALLELK